MKTIYIGAGCFWGTQGYFDQVKGVQATSVGYANGGSVGVSYEQVGKDQKHAEVVKIEYDATTLKMVEIFALHMRVIDPFSVDKQGGDKGHQYRTGFYSEDQSLVDEYQTILTDWEKTNGKTALEVTLLTDYTDAEGYHQEYLVKNPTGYCHINLSDIPDEYKKAI